MNKWAIAAGVCGALLMVSVLVALSAGSGENEQELVRRAAEANPQWPTYQEDVKGEIGARATAEWEGRPVYARVTEDAVEVTFEVRGVWAEREAAMPILMRLPDGNIQLASTRAHVDGDSIYRFEHHRQEGGLPWAEVQYPRGTLRMLFDHTGEWRATQ